MKALRTSHFVVRHSLLALALLSLGTLRPVTTMAQTTWPGYIDPEFNATCVSNAVYDSTVRSMVVQADGKIVAVGGFYNSLPFPDQACANGIFRCSADGVPDNTFNGPFTSLPEIQVVVAAPGSKFLVAGSVFINNKQHALARLHANGALDGSFQLNQTNPPSVLLTGYALGVDGAGRIVVGGTAIQGGSKAYLRRLNIDGSEDGSFAGGIVSSAGSGGIRALAVQPDNKIIVGGLFTNIGPAGRLGLARLNEDGTVDDTFQSPFKGYSQVYGLRLLGNGQLLVAGQFSTNGLMTFYLARLDSNGAFDPKFSRVNGGSFVGTAIATQPRDGKIIVTHNHGVSRFGPDGVLDANYFHGAGDIATPGFFSVAVDEHGRTLVGGEYARFDGVERRGLIRLFGEAVNVVSSPLTLMRSGTGTVKGATNGQWLEVGRSYTLTALPGAGFAFSNWTGSVTSTAAAFSFVMSEGFSLTANFVPIPFNSWVGSYNGLFRPTNGDVDHAASGFVNLVLRPDGNFTAKAQQGTRKYSFKGKFDLEGRYAVSIARAGASSINIVLNLDLHGAEEITGTVSDGVWESTLLAHRAVFNAATRPATDYRGSYTLAVLGSTNAPAEPAGTGAANFIIDNGGNVRLTGSLADGSKATVKVPLSKHGTWPLYLSLYGGKGSLLAWVQIEGSPPPFVGGAVRWSRPPGSAPKVHTNGFAWTTYLMGAGYVPRGTNVVLEWPGFPIFLSLVEGNLEEGFLDTVNLLPNGKIGYSGTNKVTMTVVPKTGLFSGTATPPGMSKPIAFKGMIEQAQRIGVGYFLGTNETGRVFFGP